MEKKGLGFSAIWIFLIYLDFYSCVGIQQIPQKKISWNDIINPRYNPNKISPWRSSGTSSPSLSQKNLNIPNYREARPIVVQQPETSNIQRTPTPSQGPNPKQSPGRWVVIGSSTQPQYQQPTTTIGPPTTTIGPTTLPGTTAVMYPDTYLYDYPSLFPDPFFFDYDYFFFPNFFSGTPPPTPTSGYSGNRGSNFVSSTEEPEYEGEENQATSTSTPATSPTRENETEAEDMTTTPKPKVSGAKVTTTTVKPVTEEIEPEDRTTPSSVGQKKQETTTAPAQENEAESVTKKVSPSQVKTANSGSNLQKSQKKETNSVQYTQTKALQTGASRKRYPPKYRFANNQGRFRFPGMKEVNVKPTKVERRQKFSLTMQGRQRAMPQNKLAIKAKGVFKSNVLRPRARVNTSRVQSAVVPKQYSYVKYKSFKNPSSSSHRPLGPVRLNNGVHLFGQKCREFRKCPSDLKPVCGTDGLSYRNKCKLHKVACLRGGLDKIGISHNGVC